MTALINDSVALAHVLGSQAQGRLPLSTALYTCSEVARLVAADHEEGRSVSGLDADHIRCTKSGNILVSGARVPHPDIRADIHAVGEILYKILTGKGPSARDPVAPSQVNPGIDSELDAVILAALAHDPARRPASLRVLEAAFGAVFEELELTASPGELAAIVAKVPRRATAAKPAPVIASRPPPAGWYATAEDSDEPMSAASSVPSWQTQERERRWMIAISAVLVAGALLWALWPAPKVGRADSDDGRPAHVSTTR